MKNIKTLRYALLCTGFFIGQFSFAAEINVKVKAVRNNNGSIICGLFTSQKGFPSESKGNAVAVQKVWFDSQAGGQGVLRHKGGEAVYSMSRLIIHMGGTKARGVEKINITKNKKTTADLRGKNN